MRRVRSILVVVGVVAGLVPVVLAPPAAACHQEVWAAPFYATEARHYVVPEAGDPGGAATCGAFVENLVLTGASAAPGTDVVSEASGLIRLEAGTTYRIRFAAEQTNTRRGTSTTSCGAHGAYQDFPGGEGPAFAAAWTIPSSATAGAYSACVVDPAGLVLFGTVVPFTVL